MEKIKIATTQNVDIEYYLPGIGTRVTASLIDMTIMALYASVAGMIMSVLGGGGLSWGLMTLISVPILLYHLAFEVFNQGQSLGKKMMGIRVVKLDGSQPSVGDYVLRWLLRPIETNLAIFYGLVGIVSISFSKKGQRLGDMLAGTTVISLKRDLSLRDTIFTWNPEGYEPRFPEVRHLNRRDVSIVKDILRNYTRVEKYELLREAGRKVASLMGVKPYELTAQQFLRLVVRDYTHYMSQ